MGWGDSSLDRLMSSRFICRAVFAQLGGVAKTLCLRLLYGGAPRRHVREWVASGEEGDRAVRDAMAELDALRILDHGPAGEGAPIGLRDGFRRGLAGFLGAQSQTPWKDDVLLKEGDEHQSLDTIMQHMHGCWDAVLEYLLAKELGMDRAAINLNEEFKPIMLDPDVKLLRRVGKTREEVTERGFEFMLRSVDMQVWEFIGYYLRKPHDTEEKLREKEEMIDFLYRLSCCRVGDYYPRAALTEGQRRLLPRFFNLGLIFLAPKSKRFYPTPLGVNLMAVGLGVGEAASSESPSHTEMRIIVQTNLKLIAYTTSKLHTGMLLLFSEIRVRLPNMVVCEITRQSIKKAVSTGVTGAQIKQFLVSHAHPVLAGRTHVIPENVSDRITLWESESTRVSFDHAIMLSLKDEDLTDAEFAALLDYARREHAGALLWFSEAAHTLVVRKRRDDERAADSEVLRRMMEKVRAWKGEVEEMDVVDVT